MTRDWGRVVTLPSRIGDGNGNGETMRYSWFDLVLYLLALVLLIPLVMRLVESVFDAMDGLN